MTRDVPIPDSYWLIDGMLLAGEYPGKKDLAGTRTKVQKFLDAGIRTFVDLPSEPGSPNTMRSWVSCPPGKSGDQIHTSRNP